jgi:hypothetical protein
MSIYQEFVDRAREKVNPSHLDYYTVERRLSRENGFSKILDVRSLLIVNPRADPHNPVEPSAAEWQIQWKQWTGEFLGAPDNFFIWWNDPSDLKYLIDEGHYATHREEQRQHDLKIQMEQVKSFNERFLRR